MPRRFVRLPIAITVLCLGGIIGCQSAEVPPPPTDCGYQLPELSEEVLPRNRLHIQISADKLTFDPPVQIVLTQSGGKRLHATLELLENSRWQKVELDGFRDFDGQEVGVKALEDVNAKGLVLIGDAAGQSLEFTEVLPEKTVRLVKYDIKLYTRADGQVPDLIIDPVLIEKP